MNCPHCQTALADPPPRFCDACGLATGAPRGRAPAGGGLAGRAGAAGDAPTGRAGAAGDAPTFRCPECGVVAAGRRCRGCGAPLRWPEGLQPEDD